MQGLKCGVSISVLVLGLTVWAGATPGSFRGTIVANPSAAQGWIYVQARNGTARRVEVTHAKVVYDEDVPAGERRSHPESALAPGTEVRVMAELGSDGEWHASRVEILKAASGAQQTESHGSAAGD